MGAKWRRHLVHRNRNGTLQVSQGIHPQDKSGENIRHSRISLKNNNMPYISSTDATYYAAQDLIYALHNLAPAIPIFKLGNGNKEALMNLA